jgi:RNA polymerase primary sigma factor
MYYYYMRRLKIEERYTNRTQAVNLYFNDVSHYQRVSESEEIELATRIRAGDSKALDRLVKANLRFVISVAKQYTQNSSMLLDFISQGNIGLIEAAKKYDPSLGFRFITYAVWFIRKEILAYYEFSTKTIKQPIKVKLDLCRAKKAEERLEMRLERKPTLEEVCIELAATGKKMDEDRLEILKRGEIELTPFDSKKNEDDWQPVDWLTTADPDFAEFERRHGSQVETLLSTLNPIEREIVEKHLGLTDGIKIGLVTLCREHGKSKEWARAVYLRAIRKMQVTYNKMKKI